MSSSSSVSNYLYNLFWVEGNIKSLGGPSWKGGWEQMPVLYLVSPWVRPSLGQCYSYKHADTVSDSFKCHSETTSNKDINLPPSPELWGHLKPQGRASSLKWRDILTIICGLWWSVYMHAHMCTHTHTQPEVRFYFVFCSFQNIRIIYCLIHSRCSVNTFWMNEGIHECTSKW